MEGGWLERERVRETLDGIHGSALDGLLTLRRRECCSVGHVNEVGVN